MVTPALAILVLAVIISLLLVKVVWFHDSRSDTNRIFAALTMTLLLWLGSSYLSSHPTNLIWSRMTIFWATFVSFLLFLLAHTIPSKRFLLSRRWTVLSGLLAGVVMVITLSPYAFTHLEVVEGVAQIVPGPGMLAFSLTTTLFACATFYHLLAKLRRWQGIERRQILMVLIGLATMIGLVISTVMIPVMAYQTDMFVPYIPLYTLCFLVMTAIAIMRYQLFEIKVIATEALVSVSVVVLLAEGLMASTIWQLFFKILFAIVATVLGYWLIKSVRTEIAQREQLAQLAKRLEKANKQLKSLDQLKTEFLSLATHQMRTPMSVIKGYTSLLSDGVYGEVTPEMEEVFRHIHEANEQFIRLISEFLDISRLEQGRIHYAFSQVNPVEILHKVLEELQPKWKEKELQIDLKPLPTEPLELHADPDKIRHVMYNFIDNAVRYTSEGSLQISLGARDGGIDFRVKDTGVGFSAADKKHFFQKFYRGKNVRKVQVDGTGLGLFMAKKFIQKHKGKIWAESEGVGKGSEFGFWIPFMKP